MTIFYINQDKSKEESWLTKFDIAKFLDGKSNVPVDAKTKIKNPLGVEQ